MVDAINLVDPESLFSLSVYLFLVLLFSFLLFLLWAVGVLHGCE